MDSNNYKYILNCVAVPEKGFSFSSDNTGIMIRLIAQAHSEDIELEVNPDHTVFIHSIITSKEYAQSFINEWFNPECIVLNYRVWDHPEQTREALV